MLINLLTNAIKYSPDNKKIILSVTAKPTGVQVTVQDFGIGIPAEYLEEIFSRYFRIDACSAIGGLGIGLYISREIINRHGGGIRAESTVGTGSTFYFSLPLPE